jgi:hypothetical protein
MRSLDTELDVTTCPYELISVGDRRTVALLGLLTDDPSLYRSGVFGRATIEPVISTTQSFLRQEVVSLNNIDLIIPLTHQSIPEDQIFANHFGGDVFPLILGGHDHCEYDETIQGARIVKSGMDGRTTNIIDVCWPEEDDTEAGSNSRPHPCTIEVATVPTNSYPRDETVQLQIQDHLKLLEELEQARLFRIRHWAHSETFSTKDNRLHRTRGSTALTTMIRMGMQATCCILNAGAIRGNKTYPNDSFFTMSDLKAELAFTTAMITIRVPGKVLEETIRYSRRYARENPPVANGCFLHTCNNMVYNDETQKLERIQGMTMDPEELYLTAMNEQFLEGIDQHIPLLEWVNEKNIRWNTETAVPVKLILVELFSAVLWLHLGNFDELDIDGDGRLSKDEVKASVAKQFGNNVTDLVVDNVFSIADMDNTGFITPMEVIMVHLIASDMLEQSYITSEDGRLEEAMKETVARVLNESDPDCERVQNMVEQIKEEIHVNPDGILRRLSHDRPLGELQRRSLLL